MPSSGALPAEWRISDPGRRVQCGHRHQRDRRCRWLSETSTGTLEAFLWTRARGMRSLGTLGGDVSEAFGVNTDRTVVGH